MQFRYDIQGLRALAVLFVLIFHINKDWLPGGFIGVDMFFVISGYLISSIILNKKNKGTFSFKDFYLSRIKRIVPAYFVFLIIITLLVSLVFINTDIAKYRVSLFWSSLFNSNNYFSTLDTYFGAASTENPLLHTWTLAIEMQFYFFLPLLLIFFSMKDSKWILIFLTILLSIYASYQIFYLNNKDSMYFSLLARSPEFFLGVLINYIRIDFTNNRNILNIMSILGCGLLFSSAFLLSESSPFPGVIAIIPCIGTCFLLLTNGSKLNEILSYKPFVITGELSYSIYLWHWSVLALYRYYHGEYIIRDPLHFVIIIFLILLLSWLSYTYIENSFRKNINKRLVMYFASIVIILGVLGLSISRLNGKLNYFPNEYVMLPEISYDY